MGGLHFGVDIQALASVIGTLKIQPPFEHPKLEMVTQPESVFGPRLLHIPLLPKSTKTA